MAVVNIPPNQVIYKLGPIPGTMHVYNTGNPGGQGSFTVNESVTTNCFPVVATAANPCAPVFPNVLPGILSGVALAFAKAVGEFGSLVIITGNLPYKTQVSSVFIFSRIESGDRAGAAAVAVVLLAISFALLLAIGAIRQSSSGGVASVSVRGPSKYSRLPRSVFSAR